MKTQNEKKPSFEDKLPLYARLAHSEWFATLYESRRIVLATTLGVIVFILAISWFFHTKKEHQVENLFVAEKIAEELKGQQNLFESTPKGKTKAELLKELVFLAKQDPIIAERFKGLIVQESLIEEKSDYKKYLQSSIAQLSHSDLPLFQEFALVVQEISENKIKEAHTRAKSMLEKKELDQFPVLQQFTLLHLAACERALSKQEELEKTLRELKAIVQKENGNGNGALYALLQEGDYSLLDFLREKK
jgi:hypothetical protein